MEIFFDLLTMVWGVVVFIVKAVLYVCLFLPVLGVRLAEWLGMWPTLWPFGIII